MGLWGQEHSVYAPPGPDGCCLNAFPKISYGQSWLQGDRTRKKARYCVINTMKVFMGEYLFSSVV